MNYLAPGTTYDKWVKAYEAKQTKSWLPYEWFDSADKLDYPGLPPFPEWYSKLKQASVCTEAEHEKCKRIFQERGMTTFGDWLEYYNRLDVEPFLLAATNMRRFYADLGIDSFKDAVSLPGVSLHYLMCKTLANPATPPLFPPSLEAYKMLKGAVVGGPSLVFTRKHVESGRFHADSMQIPARCLEVQPRIPKACQCIPVLQCSNRNPQEFLCSNRIRQVLQAQPASSPGRHPCAPAGSPSTTGKLARQASLCSGKYSKHNPASMLAGTPYVPNTSRKYSKHIQQVQPGECCYCKSKLGKPGHSPKPVYIPCPKQKSFRKQRSKRLFLCEGWSLRPMFENDLG